MFNILLTKLYFPSPRPSLVPRPRLVERLHAGLQGPLTLISAPAGAGKTTLLSQWRAGPGARVPAAWLSIDPADNDPLRFLRYLATALDSFQPGLAEEVRSLLLSAETTEPEAILTLVINHLSSLEGHALLVLDDFHHIDNPLIYTALTFLLDNLPPRLHLVVLSRADPPLPLARLRARSQLLEIRLADLRFTGDECALFLNQVMALGLTGEQVAALEKRTEGWIAGLQLAALSMRDREDMDGFVSAFTGSNRYIVEYLVEEVLGRQPEGLRQFLLKTSILQRLTGPLCDALTGTENSTQMLKELERINLFVIPLDDDGRWYRYHHLFADLLRLRLEQNHPDLLPGLHLQASRWYEAHGMLPEALDHALTAGEMELVAKIVSSNVLVLIEEEGMRTILQRIDALPPKQLSAHPWLGIARAWALGAGQVENAHRILDWVEQNLDQIPNELERKRLQGQAAAARAYVYLHQGEKTQIIAYAQLADELLPEDEISVRALNLAIWGDALSLIRHKPDQKLPQITRHNPSAIPSLEKALGLAYQSNKLPLIMVAAENLANSHMGAGSLRQAHRICQEALAFAEEIQRREHHPVITAANLYAIVARVLAEWGKNKEAIEAAQKAVQLGQQRVQIIEEIQCLGYLGRVLAIVGEWDQARQVFDRTETMAKQVSPWYWQMVTIFNLNSSFFVEDYSADEMNQQRRHIQEVGAHLPAEMQANLYIRDGHPAEALPLLDKLLEELEEGTTSIPLSISVLRAVAYHAMGNKDQAFASLRQAIEWGEPENRVAAFVYAGPEMERLLHSKQAKSISPEFVQRLLAAFERRRQRGVPPAPTTGGLLEPLSERELEILQHLARGSSDKEIATSLVIARETVHKHLKNIYGKLDVHSRTAAVARARELGLL